MKYIAKTSEADYINFLIATPKLVSCCEAARVQPHQPDPPAHDSFTRLLRELIPDPDKLWQEAQTLLVPDQGLLILDVTMLDKPYPRQMALRYPLWSGKHHRVVYGINLITLLWSDGECHIPCDYRLYDKDNHGLSKIDIDHFAQMLQTAQQRGFQPRYVVFDSWYSGRDNLKAVRKERSQRNHIGLAIRAFLRLERARLRGAGSCWESKANIVRAAVRQYLTAPTITMLAATIPAHA